LEFEKAWREGSEGPKKLKEANGNDRLKRHSQTKRLPEMTNPLLERIEERLRQLPHGNRKGREQRGH
jgi:hypothetical protein